MSWPYGMPTDRQMVEFARLHEAELRLRAAMIPQYGASYVIVLPIGFIDGDPKEVCAFGLPICYSMDIDRPMIAFDLQSGGA